MPRLSKYRLLRNYENLQKGIYDAVGEYGIPELMPVTHIAVDKWEPFNRFRACKEPRKTGLHFFIDDYQFERVWQYPDMYLKALDRFGALCTPDFSPYSDFPKAIQLYNHYRKHWIGRYWQENGLTVIPTITWSSPDTLEWAFDGEPVGGIVALSSVGMYDTEEHTRWLIDGYYAMMDILCPMTILWKGKVPDCIDKSNIINIECYTDRWR